jgi:hypothetical protein
VNYARRQQYRRLSRAGKVGLGSVIAALFGVATARAGASALAGLLLLAAGGLGLFARHWFSLARRSRVGAYSEDEVQRALAPLQVEGLAVAALAAVAGAGRHRLGCDRPDWDCGAVETKTRSYDGRHLARVREQAAWLSRRRRRWARNGALGVRCLVRARAVERVEHDLLVVSIDRLTHVLRVAANMDPNANSQREPGHRPSSLMVSQERTGDAHARPAASAKARPSAGDRSLRLKDR